MLNALCQNNQWLRWNQQFDSVATHLININTGASSFFHKRTYLTAYKLPLALWMLLVPSMNIFIRKGPNVARRLIASYLKCLDVSVYTRVKHEPPIYRWIDQSTKTGRWLAVFGVSRCSQWSPTTLEWGQSGSFLSGISSTLAGSFRLMEFVPLATYRMRLLGRDKVWP